MMAILNKVCHGIGSAVNAGARGVSAAGSAVADAAAKKKGKFIFDYFNKFLRELTVLIPAPGGQHAIRMINGQMTLEIFTAARVFPVVIDSEDFAMGPEFLAADIKKHIEDKGYKVS